MATTQRKQLLDASSPKWQAKGDLEGNILLDALARRQDHIPLDLISTHHRLANPDLYHVAWTPVYRGTKRVFDIVVAVALGLLFLPALPFVAVAIRRNSPGPVFYHQRRVGQDGAPFIIHKFRTMGVDAEAAGARYADVNDVRVTRAGRVLRRTRIDEVPQLWNIIRGEMSLIGPRPERPENIDMLERALPGFAIRTLVKPGLTGWAQVRAPYANTVDQTGRKLEYDLYYVRNASIWLDLKITYKTVRVMLGLSGQ